MCYKGSLELVDKSIFYTTVNGGSLLRFSEAFQEIDVKERATLQVCGRLCTACVDGGLSRQCTPRLAPRESCAG